MADVSYTLAALKEDLSHKGKSVIPFVTVERLTGVSSDDDDADFLEGIETFIAAHEWITSVEICWLHRRVFFTGPYVEPGTVY